MKKELKIGIFAVSILVVSFFLINYLRGEDIFDNEIEVCTRFDDVKGLVASAPVYIKGYKAGKVTEVKYDGATELFDVVCSVSREFNIPSDSKMTIYSVDIMGGKGIRIDLGTSEVYAEDGAFLVPEFEAGLMDGLSEGVGPLLEKVNNTLDSLSVTVSSVNDLLSADNRTSVSNTLTHIERTMANLGSLSASIDGKSAEIENFIRNLSNMSSVLAGVAGKVDETVSGVNDIVSSLDEAELESLVISFRQILEKINNPDGTIGKLLTDDSVYLSLDDLLSDVDSLIRKIQENPKKYIKISVF